MVIYNRLTNMQPTYKYNQWVAQNETREQYLQRILKQPKVSGGPREGSQGRDVQIDILGEMKDKSHQARQEDLTKVQKNNQDVFSKISKYLVDKKMDKINMGGNSEEELENINAITNAYLTDRQEFQNLQKSIAKTKNQIHMTNIER